MSYKIGDVVQVLSRGQLLVGKVLLVTDNAVEVAIKFAWEGLSEPWDITHKLLVNLYDVMGHLPAGIPVATTWRHDVSA